MYKGKGKKKEKGESDFFGNIWHTSVDHCTLTCHFMIPLGENWLPGKNIKTEDLEKK